MMDDKPLQILRLVDTRWLSLHNCITRIIRQWDCLKDYFADVCTTTRGEDQYRARELFNMFNCPKTRVRLCSNIFFSIHYTFLFQVYLTFCNDILKDFTRQNVNFQSENANCLQLMSDLRFFYER